MSPVGSSPLWPMVELLFCTPRMDPAVGYTQLKNYSVGYIEERFTSWEIKIENVILASC